MNLIPIIFDNDLSNMFDKNNNLIINDDISDEFTINEYIRGVIELNEDEFYTLFLHFQLNTRPITLLSTYALIINYMNQFPIILKEVK